MIYSMPNLNESSPVMEPPGNTTAYGEEHDTGNLTASDVYPALYDDRFETETTTELTGWESGESVQLSTRKLLKRIKTTTAATVEPEQRVLKRRKVTKNPLTPEEHE